MRATLKRWGWRVGVSLGLLGLIGSVFARELGFFVAPDPKVLLEVRDDIRLYDDLSRWPPGYGRFENEGFVPCLSGAYTDSGWCLAPGTQGTLRYRLPLVSEARGLLLRLFFFRRSPEAHNRLLVFREGHDAPRLTFENVYFAEKRLDCSSVLTGEGGGVVLSFEGDNPSQQPDVILQAVELRFFAEPVPTPPALSTMSLAVLALGLCLLPLGTWRRLLPLWMILTLGFALRYHVLTEALFFPEDWDALGYHQFANKMNLFSDTGFFSAQFGTREPFFVLIVKSVLWLLGDSETHVRLVGLFGSLLAIGLTYRLGTKLFGSWLGALSAGTMAITLPLVMHSVRGLRLEVELCLLLLVLEVLFVRRFRSVWLQAGLAGCLAGILGLTRATYVMTLVPLLLATFLMQRPRNIGACVLSLALLLGLQVPHRLNMARLHGDPFWESSQHLRWAANFEFAGQPGFPSQLDMWRDPGKGDGLSLGEYLFGLHTVQDVTSGTLRGLWKIITHMQIVAFYRGVERLTGLNLVSVDVGFQIMGVLGLLVALMTPGSRWIPLSFLLLLLPISFFYDRGNLEPWRHTYQAFPLFLFAGLLFLSRLVNVLKQMLNRVTTVRWAPSQG